MRRSNRSREKSEKETHEENEETGRKGVWEYDEKYIIEIVSEGKGQKEKEEMKEGAERNTSKEKYKTMGRRYSNRLIGPYEAVWLSDAFKITSMGKYNKTE